jgi:hypothetical protein
MRNYNKNRTSLKRNGKFKDQFINRKDIVINLPIKKSG